jgi:hypothetical protein
MQTRLDRSTWRPYSGIAQLARNVVRAAETVGEFRDVVCCWFRRLTARCRVSDSFDDVLQRYHTGQILNSATHERVVATNLQANSICADRYYEALNRVLEFSDSQRGDSPAGPSCTNHQSQKRENTRRLIGFP